MIEKKTIGLSTRCIKSLLPITAIRVFIDTTRLVKLKLKSFRAGSWSWNIFLLTDKTIYARSLEKHDRSWVWWLTPSWFFPFSWTSVWRNGKICVSLPLMFDIPIYCCNLLRKDTCKNSWNTWNQDVDFTKYICHFSQPRIPKVTLILHIIFVFSIH